MGNPTGTASLGNAMTPERPSQVSLAVRLVWLSLGLGIVASAIVPPHLTVGGQILFVAMFALLAWLTYKIWTGRNWARITFAVMTALGLGISIPMLGTLFRISAVTGSINLAQCILELAAIYFLFTEPGRGWFKARPLVA